MKSQIATIVLLCGALGASSGVRASGSGHTTPALQVFATGLDNPRGLTFGPDGQLYVAEAGSGGTESTGGLCPELQIGPPFGPYVNGPTARISRLDRHGVRTTVIDGLPSGQSTVPDWQGVADVAFVGNRLFALIQGGGCSYGAADFPKSIIEVDLQTGKPTVVADLGAFRRAHPSPVPDDDLEPEGVFFSMIASGSELLAVDVNTGAVVSARLDGRVGTLVDFTAAFGHITPSAIVARGSDLYVGNVFAFPIVDGASGIYRIDRFGRVKKLVGGLTAVIDLAIGPDKQIYALEMGNGQGSGFPDPGAGRVVRVDPWGRHEVVAEGLTFPTGMTFGPDGRLYVSNFGFEIPSVGTGQVVVIEP